jgi:hypothetical protein
LAICRSFLSGIYSQSCPVIPFQVLTFHSTLSFSNCFGVNFSGLSISKAVLDFLASCFAIFLAVIVTLGTLISHFQGTSLIS